MGRRTKGEQAGQEEEAPDRHGGCAGGQLLRRRHHSTLESITGDLSLTSLTVSYNNCGIMEHFFVA